MWKKSWFKYGPIFNTHENLSWNNKSIYILYKWKWKKKCFDNESKSIIKSTCIMDLSWVTVKILQVIKAICKKKQTNMDCLNTSTFKSGH